MDQDDESTASLDAYDQMATTYDAITGAAIREHYEWPAVRSLLPPLDGATVLDAACGDGFYTERMVHRGATAIAVDGSPEMVSHAGDRLSGDGRVTVREADLTDGLPFLDDGSVDLVVCQLALEHISDWVSVFSAFHRVLRPGGRAVMSTHHPVRGYVDAEYGVREHVLADGASYPDVEQVNHDWGDEDEEFLVPFFRRPLAELFGPPTDAGFVVEQVVEPEVTDALREHDPEYAETFADEPPLFLCLRLRKPGRTDDVP